MEDENLALFAATLHPAIHSLPTPTSPQGNFAMTLVRPIFSIYVIRFDHFNQHASKGVLWNTSPQVLAGAGLWRSVFGRCP